MKTIRLLRGLFLGFALSLAVARAVVLQNENISCVIDAHGSLLSIGAPEGGPEFVFKDDALEITTDRGVFDTSKTTPEKTEHSASSARFVFRLTPDRTLALDYTLRPGAAYVERVPSVSGGGAPLSILKIRAGATPSAAPLEIVPYETFWNASTVVFVRYARAGVFTGFENPFFKTSVSGGGRLALGYEPAWILGPGESHAGDPQFIGVYDRLGKMIADHYPRTWNGDFPRFRNPDGHVPLDLGEIRAMQRFMRDYIGNPVRKFHFVNYHFFHPLPRFPAPGSPEEKTLLDVVATHKKLGGDLFMFNPMHRFELPRTGGEGEFWDLAPPGSAAERIMDAAARAGAGAGYYLGCARGGRTGNAAALPFAPEKTEWKKTDATGGRAAENCMACDGFRDWFIDVHKNTINKFGLKLWSWDPGPGNGKFCHNEAHGHLPGRGDYKGWRNSTEVLRVIRETYPDIFLQAFYGRKEYGPWGFKYFTQHESYWELTIPFKSTMHPDLHADRVNADGIRFQNYWNQTFRFLPAPINHVLAHRMQEGSWDPRLTRVWDHIGWKYSVLSALSCGAGIMTVILPEDADTVPGLKQFYDYWLEWGRRHLHFAQYNIPFGSQLRPGEIDGRAAVNDNGEGVVFLCNPNPRPAKIQFALNEEIGLRKTKAGAAALFSLREEHPAKGAFFFDDARPDGRFRYDDIITAVVPAHEIVILELSPLKQDAAPVVPPAAEIAGVTDKNSAAPARGLDEWRLPDGSAFAFPFHPSQDGFSVETSFHAAPKIKRLLDENRPANLDEFESLIEGWKKKYPDNFAWARPDRLWLVLPFAAPETVKSPALLVNGRPVPVQTHAIGRPIIYYADITDGIRWGDENTITFSCFSIGENQFLGPWLDYPGSVPNKRAYAPEKSAVSSILPALYKNRVVYEKPVDAVMPRRAPVGDEGAPRIISATMTPGYFITGQKSVIRVKVNLPREKTASVWCSLPGGDRMLQYDPKGDEWRVTHKVPGERFGIIMDVAFFRVWAVGADGLVSAPKDIPVTWRFPSQTPRVADGGEIIEAETCRVLSQTGGKAAPQAMAKYGPHWSGGSQLVWWNKGLRPGDELVVEVVVKNAGTFEPRLHLSRAQDYGVFTFQLDNGPVLGAADLYDPKLQAPTALRLPAARLEPGA
ncbi:MAG: hypothetical protein LBM92_04405, partial [Opitutaceae bacterium]|nr:hypothetical protein [Opitutaceae bacterium]